MNRRLACAACLLALSTQGCGLAAPQPALQPRSAEAPPVASPAEPAEAAAPTTVTSPADPAVPPDSADFQDNGPIEDGIPSTEPVAGAETQTIEHPLAHLSDDELEKMLLDDPSSVGPMSIGNTNGGMLINAVQMPTGDNWELIDPAHAWGTQETIDALIRCIDKVKTQFPDAPKMQIGHISARRGGHLSPHRSHQAGRDVDVSYYYTNTKRWFARAHAKNLDRAKTWAFVRALITETDVEMILIDGGLQRLLREHALQIGEDSEWIDDIFRGVAGKRPALIRHARGHATHIHIRFYSPIARETARRAHPLLIEHGKVKPPVVYVSHRARKGDTLGRLANRYGTTVEAIKRANGAAFNADSSEANVPHSAKGRRTQSAKPFGGDPAAKVAAFQVVVSPSSASPRLAHTSPPPSRSAPLRPNEEARHRLPIRSVERRAQAARRNEATLA